MSGPGRRRFDRDATPPGAGGEVPRSTRDDDSAERLRGMERLADLLPQTARQFGLEDQLEQARAAASWLEVVTQRLPAASGACRLIDLRQGVATIETDEPIVAQEIRLRSIELLAALRDGSGTPVRQLRVTTRHV